MTIITLRSTKGSPLTIAELDANFSNLKNAVDNGMDYATAKAGTNTTLQTVSASVLKAGALAAINVVLIPDLTDEATLSTNSTNIQNALNNGFCNITTPGTYYLGNGPLAANGVSHYIPSDCIINISAGVTLVRTSLPNVLFANKNWKSNKIASPTISYAYNQDVTGATKEGIVTMTINTGSIVNNFAIGEYVYIKGDTSDGANGIFKVVGINNTVATSRKIYVYRYGRQPDFSTAFPTATGTLLLYKADANITVMGDGMLDYDRKCNPYENDLSVMGSILNKVINTKWEINTKNSAKYGVYFSNSFNMYGKMTDAKCPSNPIQFVGPAKNIYINGMGGEAGDDPFAICTSNVGYTYIDLLDADGTKNSDGPVSNVTIKTFKVGFYTTRGILLAASDQGDIDNVYIDELTGMATNIVPMLQLGIGSSQTAKITNLRVDVCNIHATSSCVPPLRLGEYGTGALYVSGSIGAINVTTKKGSVGMQQPIVQFATVSSGADFHIGSINAEVDASAASGAVNIVSLEGAGPYNIQIDSMNIRGTGTSRNIIGVAYGQTGTTVNPGNIQIGKFYAKGRSVQMVSSISVNDVWVTCGECILEPAVNGSMIETSKRIMCQVNSFVSKGAGGFGLINAYSSTPVQHELYVGSMYNLNGGARMGILSANDFLKLTINGGDVNGATFNTSGATLRLSGPVLAATLGIDGTKLDPTVTNHGQGSMFYNTNAAWGVGVGMYARGATTWTRIAA